MRNQGFSIIEVMVSLVVVLLVVAGTVGVINYQSRLAVYRLQSTNAQQAVETALVLIRNDLMQAGGWVKQESENKPLFVKYNGFLNFEAPSEPAENCYQVRSLACPGNCEEERCGAGWAKVAEANAFTMDRFPIFIQYDLTKGAEFSGALNLAGDCNKLLSSGEFFLESVTLADSKKASKGKKSTDSEEPLGMRTLTFRVQGSLKDGYASPAIVYDLEPTGSECTSEEGKQKPGYRLKRNGMEIIGRDICVTSFKLDNSDPDYWEVVVKYVWQCSLPTAESVPIPSTQEIRVGIPPKGYVLRIGG